MADRTVQLQALALFLLNGSTAALFARRTFSGTARRPGRNDEGTGLWKRKFDC